VTENFFAVADATSVTNSADSGVVTAVFPATAAAGSYVCQIVGGSGYLSLAAALDEVPDNTPTTITLLEDINHISADYNGIIISGKILTLDLNEKITEYQQHLRTGLAIQNTANVDVTGQGDLNITSRGTGLSVSYSTFTTSAETTVSICSDDEVGVSANGSTVMLNGDVTGATAGIYAALNNTVTVSGTVTATAEGIFY